MGFDLHAFDTSHCIALMLLPCFGSAAGCGAPRSEGAHPAGAGCVSGPPGVDQGAAQAHLGPHTLQRAGLDQWVLSAMAPSFTCINWMRPLSLKCEMCVCPVLQEAVSTGDPELVQLVLQYRDFKRATERLAGIPELLSKLRQVKLVHSPQVDPKPAAQEFICCLSHTSNTLKWFSLCCCVTVTAYKGCSNVKDVNVNQDSWLYVSYETFPLCLPGTGLLCGDEVGIHQLGWVYFLNACLQRSVSAPHELDSSPSEQLSLSNNTWLFISGG